MTRRHVMNFRWVILAATLGAGASAQADWPDFRGPSGQGIATGRLPTDWGPDKNIAWKRPIPGHGWSSPVVAKGTIFLTTSILSGEKAAKTLSLRVLALEAATGKTLWDEEVFRPEGKHIVNIHAKNSHASPTPIVDGDRILVHFGHHGSAALDWTGKTLWKNNEFTYNPTHGNGGTPALVDSLVVFSADGNATQDLIALNRETGAIVWKTPRNVKSSLKFAFSTPLIIDVQKEKQIISSGPGFAAAYDPKSGAEIWRANFGNGWSTVPRPVFGQGLVYLTTHYVEPRLYAIRPDGRGDVTKTHVAWTLSKGAPQIASPLLVGDELYVVANNGLASCLDAKTGSIHWQQRIEGEHSSSPIVADGKIYFVSENGVCTVVRASKTFERLSQNAMGEKTLASLAAADGRLYLRTEQNLYKIEEK
jgi:outer membrane protein assembly factor BamB